MNLFFFRVMAIRCTPTTTQEHCDNNMSSRTSGCLTWFSRDALVTLITTAVVLIFAFGIATFFLVVLDDDKVKCTNLPESTAVDLSAVLSRLDALQTAVDGGLDDVASAIDDLAVSAEAQGGCQGFNQANLPLTITVGGSYCAQGPLTWTTVGTPMITVQTCNPVTINFRNQQVTTAGEQTVVSSGSVSCNRVLTVQNVDAVATSRKTNYDNAVISVANTTLTVTNVRARGFLGVAGLFGGSIFARNIDLVSTGPISPSVGPDAFATTGFVIFGDSDIANVNINAGPDDPLNYGSQGFYVGPDYWHRTAVAGFSHKWRNINVIAQSGVYLISASQFDAANLNIETNAYGVAMVIGLGVRVTKATNASLTNFNITLCPACDFAEGILAFGVNELSLTNGVISGPITANCFPTSLCPVIPAPVATALLHVVPGRPASPAPQLEAVSIKMQNVDLLATSGDGAAPLIVEPAGLLTGIPPPSFSLAYNNGNIRDQGFGAYLDSSTSGASLSSININGGYYGFYAGDNVVSESLTHSSINNVCTALHVGHNPSSVSFTFNSGTNVGTATEFLDGPGGITYSNNNFAGPAPTCGTAPDPLLTYYGLIGGSKRGNYDVDTLIGQFESKFSPPRF